MSGGRLCTQSPRFGIVCTLEKDLRSELSFGCVTTWFAAAICLSGRSGQDVIKPVSISNGSGHDGACYKRFAMMRTWPSLCTFFIWVLKCVFPSEEESNIYVDNQKVQKRTQNRNHLKCEHTDNHIVHVSHVTFFSEYFPSVVG